MKITLITQDFYPIEGGISSYLVGVYNKYLQTTKFDVIVPDNIGKKKDFENLPFKVHQVKFAPFELNNNKRRDANYKILKILNRLKPDILLFGYLRSHPEIGVLYKTVNSGSRFGIFIHSKEAFLDNSITMNNNYNGAHLGYTIQEAIFYKSILKEADYIFSVSNFGKRILKKQGINRKITVIYPSITLNSIQEIQDAKKILKISKNHVILLSVGRLIKRKSHMNVIKIMPNIIKEFPNIKYYIVGNGCELSNLRSLIRILNLGKYISIFTNVKNNNLSLFYSASDIFVLPCIFLKPNDVEGFGIVFLEANSYGKPVIGANTGGIPEAILENKTGILVDPNSIQDLEKSILKLIRNKRLRNILGTNGKKRVFKDFNDIYDNSLLNIFTKIDSY